MRDQQALAWWEYVAATGYRPMTSDQWAAIPVARRPLAFRAWEDARRALFPPDPPDED